MFQFGAPVGTNNFILHNSIVIVSKLFGRRLKTAASFAHNKITYAVLLTAKCSSSIHLYFLILAGDTKDSNHS